MHKYAFICVRIKYVIFVESQGLIAASGKRRATKSQMAIQIAFFILEKCHNPKVAIVVALKWQCGKAEIVYFLARKKAKKTYYERLFFFSLFSFHIVFTV